MYIITVEIPFEYGHRLIKHSGKCRNIHGHNGVVVIEIKSQSLKQNDLVIDFGDVKKFVADWINENWDHAFLMNTDDPLGEIIQQFDPTLKVFYFQQSDPTAERMAEHLYCVLDSHLPEGVVIRAVTIYETQRSSATYMGGE